jgi:hypothetical protein
LEEGVEGRSTTRKWRGGGGKEVLKVGRKKINDMMRTGVGWRRKIEEWDGMK